MLTPCPQHPWVGTHPIWLSLAQLGSNLVPLSPFCVAQAFPGPRRLLLPHFRQSGGGWETSLSGVTPSLQSDFRTFSLNDSGMIDFSGKMNSTVGRQVITHCRSGSPQAAIPREAAHISSAHHTCSQGSCCMGQNSTFSVKLLPHVTIHHLPAARELDSEACRAGRADSS